MPVARLISQLCLFAALICAVLVMLLRPVAAILPYGGEIAFDVYDPGGPHIYLMDANRGLIINPLRSLINNAYQPAWSPDGRRLAFVSNSCDSCGNNVYVVDMDTGSLRQLTDVFRSISLDLTWSPDGSQLALVGALDHTLEDPGGIYILDVDSGDFSRIHADTANEQTPTWSPDGTQLAFIATGSVLGYPHLYLVNADGSNLRSLRNDTRNSGLMQAWSGNRLVYGVWQDGLHLVTLEGEQIVDEQLLASGMMPVWSPDGGRIAFASSGAWLWSTGVTGHVLISRPDGSDVRLVSELSLDWIVRLAWSPDGSRLAFVSSCGGNSTCTYVVDAESGAVIVAAPHPGWFRPEENIIVWRP
jgi:TolB protein